jgi:hypothetical protein
MAERAELIARLQVGLAASGECSRCHEVIVVRGQWGKPEALTDMLKQAFEEHVQGADLSKKAMSQSGNLD